MTLAPYINHSPPFKMGSTEEALGRLASQGLFCILETERSYAMPTQHENYLLAISRALRCGNPECECSADAASLHCPIHDNPFVPTLQVDYDPHNGFSFHCSSDRCVDADVLEALAKRGLAPDSWLFTSTGALEVGLNPLSLVVPHPQDWLWPDRIPMAALTLIAGFPGSGKTSIALDIAARVSVGAPAPDNPHAAFLRAPVLLASLNGSPATAVPLLRSFDADLDLIYSADTLSPLHTGDFPDPDSFTDYRESAQDQRQERHRTIEPLLNPSTAEPVTAPKPPAKPPWPGLQPLLNRLANLIDRGSAALLVVDQVEDFAARTGARTATILAMLNGLAASTGAAVLATVHNPEQTLPQAARSMRRLLPTAAAVFTTALVGPDRRRFLVPLRPPMENASPPIPYSLRPATLSWRKPIPPWRLNLMVESAARQRGAHDFLLRVLADGPQPASGIKRQARRRGISEHRLRLACAANNVQSTRVGGPRRGGGAWLWSLPPEKQP